jgi:poly(hydroxyalkanoate) depolymerase family esterase
VRSQLASLLAVGFTLGLPATAPAQGGPQPGSAQTFTYGSGPLANPYIVYTPRGYDPRHPVPLIVMVHGCQTTAYEQMEANQYNPLADEKGFVVLYPDIDATGGLQPGPTVNCWRFFDPDSWLRGQGDAARLAGMTEAVMARWNIDPQRVYMMGMSAGSFMTSIMAAAYPDLYAAVGLNAGGAYADFSCLLGIPSWMPAQLSAQLAFDEEDPRARVVPILVIGGDADTAVPPPCADKALQQGLRTDNLAIDGLQTTPISLAPAYVTPGQVPGGHSYTVSTYLDPSGCVIAERWLVHGMNHFWSGGSPDRQWAQWTDPKGPSAAAASWAFFSRFTKSDTARPCLHAARERSTRTARARRRQRHAHE